MISKVAISTSLLLVLIPQAFFPMSSKWQSTVIIIGVNPDTIFYQKWLFSSPLDDISVILFRNKNKSGTLTIMYLFPVD